MDQSCEVLIIGAGASGLSALRALSNAGCDTLCIEARNRIGGRILTIHDPLAPLPIELGPEFIHGRPPESWRLIHSGNLPAFDCEENAVHIVNGQVLEQSESWDQIAAINREMAHIADTGADPTFLSFIEAADFPEEAKQMATNYVEGFNAARKEKIGVASLALDASAAAAIEGDRNFRLFSGYSKLSDQLLATANKDHARLRMSCVAEAIHWSTGKAKVAARSQLTGELQTITARRVVLTLPLGVLQANDATPGTIAFRPKPQNTLEAARALEFGHVMRLVLRFSAPWWEDNADLADAGFWLSSERYFPTWWTTLPVRSSMLVAWSAGPHADELLGQPRDVIIGHALDDLGRIARKPRTELNQLLETVHFHDWHADPFARGAYSYVPAGAMAARRILTVPVEETLFFAGEATETEGHGATVHGAIATGERAARQVLQSLGRA